MLQDLGGMHTYSTRNFCCDYLLSRLNLKGANGGGGGGGVPGPF